MLASRSASALPGFASSALRVMMQETLRSYLPDHGITLRFRS
jgi:hypothetical protein